jgi:tetratricopeptide (TPR) repeat protein
MKFVKIILTILILLYSGLSSAQESDEKSEQSLIKKALEEFDNGNYVSAAEYFKAAYLINPKPSYIFNIARVYEITENWESCVKYYMDFLATDPASEQKKKAGKSLSKCRKDLSKIKSKVEIHSNPEGADVYFNNYFNNEEGEPVCKTPCSLLLSFGEIKILFKKIWYQKAEKTISVEKGKDLNITVELEEERVVIEHRKDDEWTDYAMRKNCEESLKIIEQEIKKTVKAEPVSPVQAKLSVEPEKEISTYSILALTAGIMGLACAGVAIWADLNAFDLNDEANSIDNKSPYYETIYWDKRHRAEDYAKLSYILFGAGGGLAAGSILFIILDSGSDEAVSPEKRSSNMSSAGFTFSSHGFLGRIGGKF